METEYLLPPEAYYATEWYEREQTVADPRLRA